MPNHHLVIVPITYSEEEARRAVRKPSFMVSLVEDLETANKFLNGLNQAWNKNNEKSFIVPLSEIISDEEEREEFAKNFEGNEKNRGFFLALFNYHKRGLKEQIVGSREFELQIEENDNKKKKYFMAFKDEQEHEEKIEINQDTYDQYFSLKQIEEIRKLTK